MKMKVRCTGYKRDEKYFTIGKVYTWEDGKLTNDNGHTYATLTEGTNIDDWTLSIWYKFEKVEDGKKHENDMTDKEIYDMLKKKLEKNGIKRESLFDVFYNEYMLIKAVSLAYRCGYARAEKGRPFKYGDKQ